MPEPTTRDSSADSPDAPDPSSGGATPARVLKAGAASFGVIGAIITGWLVVQWIEHPEARATQFDASAPLWPSAAVFVVLATAAGVALLWTAARRVEAGEDLFDQRHRRRPGGPSGDDPDE
jgi:hypothetical protein